MTYRHIDPIGLHDLSVESGSGLIVMDVREPDEFAALRAPISLNQPLSLLTEGDLGDFARHGRAEPLFVICRSGTRSARACEILARAGFTNVTNVSGGMIAWAEAGLPVVRGKAS